VDTAVTLIQALQAYGCLIDRKVEETELPDDVRQRFAAQIEFIGQFTADPMRRFERFRSSRVLVFGCGEAARSVIASLARNASTPYSATKGCLHLAQLTTWSSSVAR